MGGRSWNCCSGLREDRGNRFCAQVCLTEEHGSTLEARVDHRHKKKKENTRTKFICNARQSFQRSKEGIRGALFPSSLPCLMQQKCTVAFNAAGGNCPSQKARCVRSKRCCYPKLFVCLFSVGMRKRSKCGFSAANVNVSASVQCIQNTRKTREQMRGAGYRFTDHIRVTAAQHVFKRSAERTRTHKRKAKQK